MVWSKRGWLSNILRKPHVKKNSGSRDMAQNAFSQSDRSIFRNHILHTNPKKMLFFPKKKIILFFLRLVYLTAFNRLELNNIIHYFTRDKGPPLSRVKQCKIISLVRIFTLRFLKFCFAFHTFPDNNKTIIWFILFIWE